MGLVLFYNHNRYQVTTIDGDKAEHLVSEAPPMSARSVLWPIRRNDEEEKGTIRLIEDAGVRGKVLGGRRGNLKGRLFQSPGAVLCALVLTIFLADVAIMSLFHRVRRLPQWRKAILNGW